MRKEPVASSATAAFRSSAEEMVLRERLPLRKQRPAPETKEECAAFQEARAAEQGLWEGILAF